MASDSTVNRRQKTKVKPSVTIQIISVAHHSFRSLPVADGKSREDRTRLVSQALKIQTFFQRIKTSATKSPRDVPNKQGKMNFFLGSGRYHLNIICHRKDYNSFLQRQFRIALKEFHALLTAFFFNPKH